MKLFTKGTRRSALCLLATKFSYSNAYPESVFHGSKSAPIVTLPYGRFVGTVTGHNSVAFLGVPYAHPPIGELRFRKPVPLTAEGQGKSCPLVDVSKHPEFCVQGSTGREPGGAGSEDCLKVSIYAPRPLPTKKLPVLFYIHGGGFRFGHPAAFPFEHWIEQSPEIVVVSVYYRLSVFGFLSFPLAQEDSEWGDFNVGLWDQIEALRWTREHISHFGGDPDRVTIVGESAGGASVQFRLTSPIAQGLFHGAIGQSVYRHATLYPYEKKSDLPWLEQEHYSQFVTDLLIAHDVPPKQHMKHLRSASVAELIQASDSLRWSEQYEWHPVVDGKLITDYPTNLLFDGRQARVPVIAGATTDETSLEPTKSLQENLQFHFPRVKTVHDVADFEAAYPLSEFGSGEERIKAVIGDTLLKCSREIQGEVYSRPGSTSRVWTYRFNQRNPTEPLSHGVAHAADNWFMFRGVNTGFNGTAKFTEFTVQEAEFGKELIAYRISFVRTGDPNTFKLSSSPNWLPYEDARHASFNMDTQVDDLGQGQRLVLQQLSASEESNAGQIIFELPGHRSLTGSYMEEQPESEMNRCAFVASKVPLLQN